MKPYHEEDGITIYHGDCREVLPSLVPESVTLLWTDPPYGHSNLDGDLAASRIGVRGGRQVAAIPIAQDSPEEMRRAVDAMFSLAVPLLRRDCCCCCCCGGGGPSPSFAWLAERMDRDGLSFFHALIWDKSGRGDGLGWRFRRNYEMLMVSHRRGGRLAWTDESKAVPNVWRIQPVPNEDHPTSKPLALPSLSIQLHTAPGDLVLDPFMGAGPSLEAAQRLGRRAIGIEIEERYCEIAAKRLAQKVLPLEAMR